MKPSEIVEHGTDDEKIALVNRVVARHMVETVGFMWTVLNYRVRSIPNHPAIPAAPIKVAQAAKGFAPGQFTYKQTTAMGQWIYDHFADEINISAPVKKKLDNHHATPADFDAAYHEISSLIDANFREHQ